MKTFFLIVVLSLLTRTSFAANSTGPINFTCAVPTTVFDVKTAGNNVTVDVLSPYGIQYTPIYKGNLATVSLQQLEVQKEYIAKLGNEQKFVWPLDQCTVRNGNIYYCTGAAPFTVNGVQIQPILFRTILNNLSMDSGDYKVYTVEVVFRIAGMSEEAGLYFSLTSDYDPAQHCQ